MAIGKEGNVKWVDVSRLSSPPPRLPTSTSAALPRLEHDALEGSRGRRIPHSHGSCQAGSAKPWDVLGIVSGLRARTYILRTLAARPGLSCHMIPWQDWPRAANSRVAYLGSSRYRCRVVEFTAGSLALWVPEANHTPFALGSAWSRLHPRGSHPHCARFRRRSLSSCLV